MGESSLERNALEVYNVCVESSTDKARCKEMAKEYAEDKADAIQDFFEDQLRAAERYEAGKWPMPPHKRDEYEYRKNKAIPDALKRVKGIIDEL